MIPAVPDPEAVNLAALPDLPGELKAWLVSSPAEDDVLEVWHRLAAVNRYLARRKITSKPAQYSERLVDLAVADFLGDTQQGRQLPYLVRKLNDKIRADLRRLREWPGAAEDVWLGSDPDCTRSRVLRRIDRLEAEAAAPTGDTILAMTAGSVDIRHGDFRVVLADIPDGSVDLVFCDPPYSQEALPLWGELGRFAARVLKPGRLLFAYTGQLGLRHVLNALAEHLDDWWIGAVVHDTAHYRLYARRVQVGWKPVVVFRNGSGPMPSWWVDACTAGHREKESHEWGQAEAEAAYWIGQLTRRGDTVVDPFSGGGTTAAAAWRLGRHVITCDLDSTSVASTTNRFIS